MSTMPIIIPAYEPDDRLIALLKSLDEMSVSPVIIVNDGSGPNYDSLFHEAEDLVQKKGGCLLNHSINRGKGRALKTAFEYVLNHTDAIGVITADSDGQHTVEDIIQLREQMQNHSDSLILGVRRFDQEDIPWKSRFGNNLTKYVFKYITGVLVTDTQTGLRGIPRDLMQKALQLKGERFELEMRMLVEAAGKVPIIEVPIETIYDSKDNHQTHFHPLKDSIRIYRILCERFFRFLISGVSSSALDLCIFTVGCLFLKNRFPFMYAGIATVIARLISAIYNYLINYNLVFNSEQNVLRSGIRYAILAIVQMMCSAGLIVFCISLMPRVPELILKIVIDTLLFFISYHIQQHIVFR